MNATAQSAIDSKGVRTRRRRRLTFSLRTFFVLLTAGTLWLGWKVEQGHNQREAVEAIREIGGRVVYDWQAKYVGGELKNGKSHVFIGFRQRVRQSPKPNGPAWLQQLIGDEYFQEVEQVAFLQWEPTAVPIPDAECRRWIQLLERLPKLRTLVIVRFVSDEALCNLRDALPHCDVFPNANISWAM